MSKYTGPKFRIARRLNFSVYGDSREFKNKKRNYIPGMHGPVKGPTPKTSDYGLQLREKQKIRFTYGLSEKQLYKTFLEANKLEGIHGENFLKLLESRLDNIVYRLGYGATRAHARQLVNHGHILVDGKKIDIPSFRLKAGQTVAVAPKSRSIKSIQDSFLSNRFVVPYCKVENAEELIGSFQRYPLIEEIGLNVKVQMVVEFYNR
jgi:small subunit ribosomal protein S4